MGLNAYSVNEGGVLMKFEENVISIIGSIDCRDPYNFMEPFFDDVHEHIIKQGIKSAGVDIIMLSFLNSSVISVILDWITKIQCLDDDSQKYLIKFLCSSEFLWQKPSISALIVFDLDLLKMEIN